MGVAPLTSPPRSASPPPPLHRQVSTTVAPTNRSDRPSLLARNLSTHVVLGSPEDEQLLPVYRAPCVNRAAATAPAAATSSPMTASAAARRTGQRTATARRRLARPRLSDAIQRPPSRWIVSKCERQLQLSPAATRWPALPTFVGQHRAQPSDRRTGCRRPPDCCFPAERKFVKSAGVAPLRAESARIADDRFAISPLPNRTTPMATMR